MAIFRFPGRITVSLELMSLDFIFFTFLKHSQPHPQCPFRISYLIFHIVANHGLNNLSFKNFTFRL